MIPQMMNTSGWTAIVVLMTCLLAPAQSRSKADPDSKLTQEFATIYQTWDRALQQVDIATLRAMSVDDYVIIAPDGSVEDKETNLANLKSGKDVVSAAATDELKVRRHGDTAVVTSRWTAKEVREGKDLSGQSRWTDVWVRRAGRWKLVSTHGSNVQEGEANAIRAISQGELALNAALIKGDVPALERILGVDYLGTGPDGKLSTRVDLVQGIKSGKDRTSSAATDGLKISVYGNTAVATGRWTARGRDGEKEWGGVYRFTDTWVYRNGIWQMVADHWSAIETK